MAARVAETAKAEEAMVAPVEERVKVVVGTVRVAEGTAGASSEVHKVAVQEARAIAAAQEEAEMARVAAEMARRAAEKARAVEETARRRGRSAW